MQRLVDACPSCMWRVPSHWTKSWGVANREINTTSEEPTTLSWGLAQTTKAQQRQEVVPPPHPVEWTRWDELRREA